METERTISKLLETASGGGAVEEDFTLQEPKNISSDQLPRLLRSLETTTRHVTHLLFAASDFSDKRFSRETLAAILEAMERNRDHCCSKVRTLDFGEYFHLDQDPLLQHIANGLFPLLESLSASADYEATRLGQTLERLSHLRSLRVYRLKPVFFHVLLDNMEALKGLTLLSVGASCTSDDDRKILISLPPRLPALRSLSLEMSLTVSSGKYFVKLLPALSALTELGLKCDDPAGKGAVLLIRQLHRLTAIERVRIDLKIRGRRGTADASAAFASCLARMPQLKALAYRERAPLSWKFETLAENLHLLPELTELSLSGDFTTTDTAVIRSAFSRLKQLRDFNLSCLFSVPIPTLLVENLHLLTALEKLVINFSRWSPASGELLVRQLRSLAQLITASLTCTGMGDAAFRSIADECGRLSQLRRLDLYSYGADGMDDATKIELQKRTMFGRDLSHLESLDVGGVAFRRNNFREFVESYPLHFAARCGDVTLVREVLASKVDANQIETSTEDTAIFHAARGGHDEVIRVLVQEGGASLSVKNKLGLGVMDLAPPKSSTRALLEEMILTGADERPGEMIKGAAKRFKPAPPQD